MIRATFVAMTLVFVVDLAARPPIRIEEPREPDRAASTIKPFGVAIEELAQGPDFDQGLADLVSLHFKPLKLVDGGVLKIQAGNQLFELGRNRANHQANPQIIAGQPTQ